MRAMIVAMALALSTGLPAGASAATAPPTGLAVFGDSLSDPGNLFALTGQPPAPYLDGRFSNGPVWAEEVAVGFAVGGNFAFGGAKAVTNADGIPDLAAQIGLFAGSGLRAALGERPLAAVWLGANDLFAGLASGDVAGAIANAGAALASGYAALRTQGFEDFVLFDLPDLGKVPLYNVVFPSASTGASQATQAFNATLSTLAMDLRADGARVTEIGIDALFTELRADPARFGIADTVLPCLFTSQSPGVAAAAAGVAAALDQPLVCDAATADARAFFDLVHPNRLVHAAIAEAVEAALQPAAVPLPASAWLLAGGVGGLAAFGRRRARAA